MLAEINAEDLEKEIILMEQELILKKELLDECRKKLNSEISEHIEAKLTAHKYVNENKELQIRLEVCLKGTQILEEENTKNRETLAKLQAQLNAYLSERKQLSDACFEAEKEKTKLKNDIEELKQQIKEYEVLLEYFRQMKPKTEALLSEIMSKQEILNKEQIRLEAVCKEGLRFAEKLSEENKFQTRFIQEAKIGQAKMENQMIRLMGNFIGVFWGFKNRLMLSVLFDYVKNAFDANPGALRELQAEKENKSEQIQTGNSNNYIEMWKSHQKEMITRNEELGTINKQLTEEINSMKEQIDMLLKNY